MGREEKFEMPSIKGTLKLVGSFVNNLDFTLVRFNGGNSAPQL
jgi:hypothetical protein